MDATTAARFERLRGICHRILWSDFGIPAIGNEQTDEALRDLAEFTFLDAYAEISATTEGKE